MKITIYMAMSVDGYIADRNGKTPWSEEEWVAFNEFQSTCAAILVGSKTYEEMLKHDELADTNYYVATRDGSKTYENATCVNIETADDLPIVANLGVTGGTDLNSFIMNLGVVDELIIDVEPLLFGGGVSLFKELVQDYTLSLLDTKKLNDSTVQLHYKLLK